MNANATDNSAKIASILDLDALLDTEMDLVETLPDFINPPAGLYQLVVKEAKFEKYKSKDLPDVEQTRIRVTRAVEKTYEVVDGSSPVADGSLFSETFMGTEEGVKFFKKAAMGVLGISDFEGAKLRDVIEAIKDVSYKARITIRTTKASDGSGKVYENLQIRAVPADA